jgi:hypothetical protein
MDGTFVRKSAVWNALLRHFASSAEGFHLRRTVPRHNADASIVMMVTHRFPGRMARRSQTKPPVRHVFREPNFS